MTLYLAESAIHSRVNQGKTKCGSRLFEQTSLNFAGEENKLQEVSSEEGDDVTKFIATAFVEKASGKVRRQQMNACGQVRTCL